MITVGVDLAADRSRTAAARIGWGTGGAVVDLVAGDAADDAIVAMSASADRIGIDCPLGWPDAFIDFVTAHRDGLPVTAAAEIRERRPLVYRATDLFCQERGLRPLSVSADRIGHAALRCAALLPRLARDGADAGVDRSGDGRVVEAYPAGSLRLWGLPHQRYKNDPALLESSLAALERVAGLRFADPLHRALCATSDHAFDAVVTALTARAAALGQTAPPPPELRAAARREGWIALPTCGLDELAG